jgi:alpha-tubulin suppressor-like RCC1 family protein
MIVVGAALAPRAAAVTGPGVYGFGGNTFGELGNGTTTASLTPVPAIGLPGTVRQIAAGYRMSAALLSDGTVWTWGNNGQGQLGYSVAGNVLTPRQVPGLTGIIQIAAGDGGDGYAVGSDGSVWAWGANNYGQLGNGTTTPSTVPIKVPGLTGVTKVAAGSYNDVLALMSNGTVRAWGENDGELGDGTTTTRLSPVVVQGLSGITQIATGSTSYAVRSDGTLFSWGDNSLGQLGNGTTGGFTTRAAAVAGITGVTQVATDGLSTLAVAGTNERLWAWGDNICGQLGDGTTVSKSSPEQIGLVGVTQVAVGVTYLLHQSSAAVRFDGSLWTWGGNGFGQLGHGPVGALTTTPVAVSNLANVSQFVFGDDSPGGPHGGSYGLAIGSLSAVVPNLIGDTRAQASAALQAAGLVLGTVSMVVDSTCANIGTVVSQNPGPGTTLLQGSSVNIAIGTSPPPPRQCL